MRLLYLLCAAAAVLILTSGGCERKEPAATVVVDVSQDTAGETVVTEVPEAPETEDAVSAKEAALKVWVDSLMTVDVALPALFDEKAYDTSITNTYETLAKKTGGELKIVATADKLQGEIQEVLCANNKDGADILFMIDNSGSMEDDIDAVKKGMRQIIEAIQDRKFVRLAVAIYRDKQGNGNDWFAFRNFGKDYDAATRFIDSMHTIPNADIPESVYEAFFECSRQDFWRSGSRRMTIIIGDAAGKVKENGGAYSVADVIRKASEGKMKVNLFPILVTPLLEKFRQKQGDGPVPYTPRPLISRIYPNPTTGLARMDFLEEGLHHVEVYTAGGAVVNLFTIDDNYWEINLRDQPDGLYVVRVRDRNNQYDVGKVVVHH